MGSINFGIPKDLTLFLKNLAKIEIFIETGTYLGETSKWAADNFENVFTIENSNYYYSLAKKNLKSFKNLKILKGHTLKVLPKLLKLNNQKTMLFWLDAHWCGDKTYGVKDECPLISELKIILKSSKNNIIFVDDARLFVSPPPKPHDSNGWPNIQDVVSVVNKKDYYISIFEDVIIFCPKKFENKLKKFIVEGSVSSKKYKKLSLLNFKNILKNLKK